MSVAIQGGLFHPRCKDSTSTYYEGISECKPVSQEEMAEMECREQLEQKQQYADRQSKRFARRAKYSLDPDNKRVCSARAEEWQSRAESLCESVAKSADGGIIKERNIVSRNLPNGWRTQSSHILTDDEIQIIKNDISEIGADNTVFKFNEGFRTGYDDVLDEVRVKGDVLPDLTSKHPRDMMSSRAALAHEYYGHRVYRGTRLEKGSWNNEFRASYMAAKNCPHLTNEDRRYLILDALERAKEQGVSIKYNNFIRRVLYG